MMMMLLIMIEVIIIIIIIIIIIYPCMSLESYIFSIKSATITL